jgi:hypothetical protein
MFDKYDDKYDIKYWEDTAKLYNSKRIVNRLKK